jgi:class I fructose-bisphosphate aldolase
MLRAMKFLSTNKRNKENYMSGKEIRLAKLFDNGKAVIIAADHGSYMGPFDGIDNLPKQIHQFSNADAFLLMPGMARHCRDFFRHRNSPLEIIRVNWASHYCKPHFDVYTKGFNVKLVEIEYAVSLGADIVIASLLLGTDEEANTRNITEFGYLVEHADRLGIPLIGEYIPFGGIDQYQGDIDKLLLGTRALAEFGADLIKTVFIEAFERVTSTAVIPTLALGGGLTKSPSAAYSIAAKAIQKGASGVVFGRNVICAQNPTAYLEGLIQVVKHGQTPAEAEERYLALLA